MIHEQNTHNMGCRDSPGGQWSYVTWLIWQAGWLHSLFIPRSAIDLYTLFSAAGAICVDLPVSDSATTITSHRIKCCRERTANNISLIKVENTAKAEAKPVCISGQLIASRFAQSENDGPRPPSTRHSRLQIECQRQAFAKSQWMAAQTYTANPSSEC